MKGRRPRGFIIESESPPRAGTGVSAIDDFIAEQALGCVAKARGQRSAVPADLIDRLRGDTEEEMSADADALLKLVKPGGPKPDTSQGSRSNSTTSDMNTLLRAAAGRA